MVLRWTLRLLHRTIGVGEALWSVA
jgi:hypothetical protein